MWCRVRGRALAFLLLAFLVPLFGASVSSAGVPVDALIYVSSTSAGSVPSGPGSAGPTIAFGNEDVLVYDSAADTWAIAFDGSAAGVGAANVDGFSIDSSGGYLISFAGPTAVPGVTATVDDSDVVTWDGTSFTLLIDGSDVGLTAGGEDIDAIATSGPSSYVFSTLGSAGVPKTGGGNLAARDEDLIELTATSTGSVTNGTFALGFDGSDVSLSREDIVGAHIDTDTGVVYASVLGGYNVGFTGDGDDIVAFTGTTGEATSGTYALFFNGDDHDFGREQIDAVHVEFQAGPPQGEADLSVTKSDSADPVIVGDTITYTVTVSNAGPDTAVNVVAAETLPAGVTFVSTTGCTQDPSGLPSCSLGNVDAGASAAYTIDAIVDQGTSGTVTNSVTVTSDSVDSNPADNTATEDTDIAGVPVAVDDGPATSSTPGDPFHTPLDTVLVAADGGPEDLLNNDSLGDPAAMIVSFGGGDLGGSVTDNAQGDTVTFGAGSLAVNDNGSFSFTPDTGFGGIFSFEYRIENSGGSSDAIVSVFVGERPTAGGADLVYLSMTSTGTVDALTYDREDVIVYDTGTSTWDIAFDGSDVGLAGANIDAFTIVENGDVDEILFSLSAPTVIPGISPRVDDSDVVRFVGSGGVDTIGTLELFIDGSDVSLRSGGEDVDALSALGGGYLMSVLGGFNVPAVGGGALVGGDEDLIEFDATGTGPVTSGAFSVAFDGSDVDLQQEDLTGAWVDPGDGSVFATSLNGFNVPGLSGDSNDVFVFTPGTTGPDTSGTFSLFFDLDTTNLTSASKSVDGLHIERRDAPPENQPPDAVDDGYSTDEDSVLTVAVEAVATAFGSPGSGPGEFNEPYGVAVDGAGNIVVADSGNDRVQVCDTAGVCEAFGSEGSGPGEFNSPFGVAVDGAGNIVVADSGNDRVQVCDTAGACTAFGSGGSDLGQFDTPFAVAVDGAGNIVVADKSNDRVQVCTAVGVCEAFGSEGSGPGEFSSPYGVAVDGAGNIVVADRDNNRVQVCTAAGVCTAFGSFGSGLGQFSGPRGVAVDGAGNIVVADANNHRVQVCDTAGVCTAFGSEGSDSGQFRFPWDVGVDGAGNIVVADVNNDRVQIISFVGGVLDNDTDPDSDLLAVSTFDATSAQGATVTVNSDGSFTYDPTSATALQGLAVGQTVEDTFEYTVSDGNGGTDTATVTITVTGVNDDPVAVDDGYSTDEDSVLTVAVEAVISAFGSPASGLGQFREPVGVAVDGAGNIVVADVNNNRVQVCDTAAVCTAFGSQGSDLGQFNQPSAVAVDGAGNIVVADRNNHRVQVCTAGGVCTAFGSFGSGLGQFSTPPGVAVDGAGNIVVADSGNNRVQVCDTAGGACTAFGSFGSDLGQFRFPRGVAVDGAGNIVVADTNNYRVRIVSFVGGVLDNDTDPDSDLLTVSTFDATSVEGAAVTVNADGSFTYDPSGVTAIQDLDNGESLVDTFEYTISDGNGGTDSATVTITVAGIDDD